jgi:solute carrier family 9B (sodium/hydrogen exchanger), member 1/2
MQIIKLPFRCLARCVGLNKGIHTVIIAMTSLNDVIAIFLFGVLCGIVFSTGDLTHQLLQGPVGIVMGCVFGALSGFLVIHLPSDNSVCHSISP